MYDVIILGGGPAGLTAAIYTSRAKLSTKFITGPNVGGQIALTYQVDNYPGDFETVSGPDLIERMVKHAEKYGSDLDRREATKVDFSKTPYKVCIGSEVFEGRSVIIATGSKNRLIGLDSETRLMGKGVFVCATCDAALYEELRVVVVGGGDSAVQEALDLTKFAKEVFIVHRGNKLTASKSLTDQANLNPKIKFMMNTKVIEIIGEEFVEAIQLKNRMTGEETRLETDGVLIAIGWIPNTELFKDELNLSKEGYITSDGVKTEKPGVFVAGDLNDTVYRQLVTACASGAKAAIEAERYISGI